MDLDGTKIHSVAARLKHNGLNVSPLCCDVTDEHNFKALLIILIAFMAASIIFVWY